MLYKQFYNKIKFYNFTKLEKMLGKIIKKSCSAIKSKHKYLILTLNTKL